ncbi:hypothetical protein EVAR_3887_1 [Eumeta japonica]|uniref:Uncharacterized protein n=1 Tax=Eumeta variegata TaxID=151549 RepID=A0A4C1SQU9_EUMVA|nr:hypothetical protein EVAR_3887_1 [Eumeta japonica]
MHAGTHTHPHARTHACTFARTHARAYAPTDRYPQTHIGTHKRHALWLGSPPWDLEQEPLRPCSGVERRLSRNENRRRDRSKFCGTLVAESGWIGLGKYLYQISRKEPTAEYHYCNGRLEDIVRHTLETCPAWAARRAVLKAVIGRKRRTESANAAPCLKYAADVLGAEEMRMRQPTLDYARGRCIKGSPPPIHGHAMVGAYCHRLFPLPLELNRKLQRCRGSE